MPFSLKNTAQASPEEIAELERRIGMSLPDDYKAFLAENNGGKCTSGGVFRDAVTREKISRINVMLGLREDPNYDIEKKLSIMESRVPPQLLPIAYDSGGNYLLLDTADGRRGTIYFLSLESADPDDPPSLDSLAVVASSFTELRTQVDSNI